MYPLDAFLHTICIQPFKDSAVYFLLFMLFKLKCTINGIILSVTIENSNCEKLLNVDEEIVVPKQYTRQEVVN